MIGRYIRTKWRDLKSEIEEWNLYCAEAKHMSETSYFYGIRDVDTLSTAQIMSVLLFANDYSLQSRLNKSYTK